MKLSDIKPGMQIWISSAEVDCCRPLTPYTCHIDAEGRPFILCECSSPGHRHYLEQHFDLPHETLDYVEYVQ